MDENNSAILKQKKKIDKLDNDNKIIAQEKNYHQDYIYHSRKELQVQHKDLIDIKVYERIESLYF